RPELPHSLPQKRTKRGLVDVGQLTQFDVPHILALAFEEPLWVLQRGTAEETKLDKVRSRINIGDRDLSPYPAAVTPFHRLLKCRSLALHELPQRTDK